MNINFIPQKNSHYNIVFFQKGKTIKKGEVIKAISKDEGISYAVKTSSKTVWVDPSDISIVETLKYYLENPGAVKVD